MKDKNRELYEKRKRERLGFCPGHWINKGYGVRNTDCYVDGICDICGQKERGHADENEKNNT